MTLNRNVTDYHAEIEQAAFEPNNLVPGIGLSPDKMLLARGFSYADAHRARLGVNYKQIPVNGPQVEVHSYSKDGAMRISNATDPVYAPNSYGRPGRPTRRAPPRCTGRPTATWSAPPTRCARGRRLGPGRHPGPRGSRRRRAGPVGAQHRRPRVQGVREPVLLRVFEYWSNVDADLGKTIEEGVRANWPKR